MKHNEEPKTDPLFTAYLCVCVFWMLAASVVAAS